MILVIVVSVFMLSIDIFVHYEKEWPDICEGMS